MWSATHSKFGMEIKGSNGGTLLMKGFCFDVNTQEGKSSVTNF